MNAKFYNYLHASLVVFIFFYSFINLGCPFIFHIIDGYIRILFQRMKSRFCHACVFTNVSRERIRARKFAYLFRDMERWQETSLMSFADIAEKTFVELSRTMLREETRSTTIVSRAKLSRIAVWWISVFSRNDMTLTKYTFRISFSVTKPTSPTYHDEFRRNPCER